MNPVTNKIYVANLGDRGNVVTNVGSATIIDGVTNSTTNIADPNAIAPHAVAVNPLFNKIYFANANYAGTNDGNGGVTVVDGLTNSSETVTDPNARTTCNVFDTHNIAVDPARNRVYLANACSNNVTLIDGFSHSTRTIADPQAAGPRAVAVNPITHKTYVANSQSNNVTVIDALVERLMSTPAPPFVTGSPITWTAVPGPDPALEYQFWLYDSSSKAWTLGQAYSHDNTWSWTPARSGVYVLQAWVRRIGSSVSYEDWTGTGRFSVTEPVVTAVTLRWDRTFPVPPGTTVTWTAAAVGGIPEYQFWLYDVNARVWTIGQPYGAARTWSWTPTKAGTYAIQVWARHVGSGVPYRHGPPAGSSLSLRRRLPLLRCPLTEPFPSRSPQP